MNPTKSEMTVLGLRFLAQLNHPSLVYTDTSRNGKHPSSRKIHESAHWSLVISKREMSSPSHIPDESMVQPAPGNSGPKQPGYEHNVLTATSLSARDTETQS